MMPKQRVLILCTGNSARSQMAEGWLHAVADNRFEVFSAGSTPTGTVHPAAIQVMAEIGIDISHHYSKGLSQFIVQPFDNVLTVCDDAAEVCPVFPGKAVRYHHSFPDPAKAPAEQRAETFRMVRDSLINWLRSTFSLSE